MPKSGKFEGDPMRRSGLLTLFLLPTLSLAQTVEVPMNAITATGIGPAIGKVLVIEKNGGVELLPSLRDLPPGVHGFHVHENPACGAGEKDGRPQAGLAAGAHYDPDQSGKHQGPDGAGHRGDLTALNVAEDGTAATGSIRSARLSLSELHGRSLMIHADPDNYADQPGGARIACGVIP
jgi:superoxide dismutase, Cu-Zn family